MNFIKFFAVKMSLLFVIIAFGCGVTITKESAQQSIDNAYSAIETAKVYPSADINSQENLRKADRLLSDAEDALRRNRRQRAYTLANRAIEMAKLAQGEAEQDLDEYNASNQAVGVNNKITTLPDKTVVIDEDIPESVEVESVKVMTKAGMKPPASKVILQGSEQSEVMVRDSLILIPKENQPMGSDISTQDVQNRIKAAIQALEEAQKAVQSARLLMFKTQTEIGLSSASTIVRQVRENGAPVDVVNMIVSRYDQARKVAGEGNYEGAVILIEQAQTYAGAFLAPVEKN